MMTSTAINSEDTSGLTDSVLLPRDAAEQTQARHAAMSGRPLRADYVSANAVDVDQARNQNFADSASLRGILSVPAPLSELASVPHSRSPRYNRMVSTTAYRNTNVTSRPIAASGYGSMIAAADKLKVEIVAGS
jgi:hypothetical protein